MALRSVISVFRPLTTLYKPNAVTILKCLSPKLNYVGFIQNNVRLSTVSHRNRTKVPVKSGMCNTNNEFIFYRDSFVGIQNNNGSVSGFDESKAKIVLALNFQSPEDTLPFYKLPIRTLIHIYKVTKDDESKGYCKNRLYYIASRIQVITIKC